MYATLGTTLPVSTDVALSPCAKAIIKTLLYYDVFQYPLQEHEIYTHMPVSSKISIEEDLAYLVRCQLIGEQEGFYCIGDGKEKVSRRRKGNLEAEKYLHIASKHARWLSELPFVDCICISGSLSKNYMDEKSDIDYFIIADTNRLWIFRAILSLICKILWVLRSQKYFCPNYIITPYTLEIKDKNIYTAIEIATLVPLYNATGYADFIQANLWIKEYLPNLTPGYISGQIQLLRKKKPGAAWVQELLTTVDENLYWLYKKHYQRKFEGPKGLNIAFSELNFNKHIYKMHLAGHRNKILDRYEESLQTFTKQYGVDLLS
ncbi:hypothetical protein GXP67_24770 [Rhodocytophaga rosea]|uniref:Nucleotidyltransferase domain-containing protein n=1 Tax=Rhodocytophaga rosea TaxID=2704465 RepID=A0A6C0GQ37_9BACT|nr:hypothetical protein [Rhodocytophaga rosea]QHT69630.1 hypothetical protein GXP67_24770 [Rhodocytophaga rosea]